MVSHFFCSSEVLTMTWVTSQFFCSPVYNICKVADSLFDTVLCCARASAKIVLLVKSIVTIRMKDEQGSRSLQYSLDDIPVKWCVLPVLECTNCCCVRANNRDSFGDWWWCVDCSEKWWLRLSCCKSALISLSKAWNWFVLLNAEGFEVLLEKKVLFCYWQRLKTGLPRLMNVDIARKKVPLGWRPNFCLWKAKGCTRARGVRSHEALRYRGSSWIRPLADGRIFFVDIHLCYS